MTTPNGDPRAYARGLDVSQWQGNRFPFRSAAGEGFCFAYIRASVRVSLDPNYPMHRVRARNAGLLTGSYHYLYPFPDAADQARTLALILNNTDGPPDELPPCVDVEENLLEPSQIQLFVDTIHRHTGHNCLIYTSRYKWHAIAGTNALWASRCPLWVADWEPGREEPRLPHPWRDWSFWQFTSRGSISNHYGRVDLNYYNGTAAHLRKYYPELWK